MGVVRAASQMNSPMSCSQHIPPLLLAHLSALCVQWQQSDAFDGSQGPPTSVSAVFHLGPHFLPHSSWPHSPHSCNGRYHSELCLVTLQACPSSVKDHVTCHFWSDFETGIHSLLPFLVSATLTARFQLWAPDSRLSSTAPQFMSQ